MEKPKIQIFCLSKKLQFSNKNSQKFCFCKNSVSLFLPGFVPVYIFFWLIQVVASISDLPKKKIIEF
jgi:hypothetical protein